MSNFDILVIADLPDHQTNESIFTAFNSSTMKKKKQNLENFITNIGKIILRINCRKPLYTIRSLALYS